MAPIKPSYKSLEGIIAIAINASAAVATGITLILNHHVFVAYPHITEFLVGAIGLYNTAFGYFRTSLKRTALIADFVSSDTATADPQTGPIQ